MNRLLMITGLGAVESLARGDKGALYSTLEELHHHWERIDIICPRVNTVDKRVVFFGNVHIHISPYPLIFHPMYFIFKAVALHRALKFDCMVVHEFPPFYNGIGARIIWYLTKIPYILEIHHIPGYPKAASMKEVIYRWLCKIFLAFDAKPAKVIRVVNKNQSGEFLRQVGVPQTKIRYIPSMYIDLELFKPVVHNLSRSEGIEDPRFKNELGQPITKKYDCIFVGRLEKNKGITLFLQAVRQTNCSALIVGTGPLLKDMKLQATRYKLQANFHGWAKNQHEIAGLLNQSRVLVMCSYNEGGPRVMLEAMACGVPVVVTNVGLVSDLIVDGQSGRIADWHSDDIAGKIKSLLNNADLYRRCSIAGIEIAQRFEKKKMIEDYANAIKNLI